MSVIIAPSILSCDFGNLERDFELINNSQADWFHVDVMDGVFVPNISFGFPIIGALKKVAKKTIDCHVMIVNPDLYINDFAKLGVDILTVHYEACMHLHRTIAAIKEAGMKAGVALNPHTPVSVLEHVIADLDLVLIMSVNPGFGGQKFIPEAIEKVRQTKALIAAKGSTALIEVDGGVNAETGKLLVEAGADALVAGSFVFNSPNPTATIEALKSHSYSMDTTRELSLALSDALKQFQLDHALKADGVNGKYTNELLSESPLHQQKRTLLALEKMRWRKENPTTFLHINIPSFTLDYVFNDTLRSTHRVVVGKLDTPTPSLQSKLGSIIALPYWTEPYSIASTEFLAAIKRNTDYAKRNQLKVFKNGQEVNPSAVNWKRYSKKNFPFTIRQEPGIHNALGLIKFEFANNFSVYIHDTPSKTYFQKDIRAFSHGCMRCEQPDSLARLILRNDVGQKTIPDSLIALIARKEHRRISLRHPIPIIVDYITVTVSADNKRIIHVDVYKKDEEYLRFFN